MTTRKRGSTWMADFMVAGNRYRETFSTESEAKEWELMARAAIVAGRPLPPVSNQRSPSGGGLHTLGALLDHTEQHHWRNNPQITEPETAIRNGRQVVEFFGRNMPVSAINEAEMKRLVSHILGQGWSQATADRKLAALSKMLRFAVEAGVIPRVPKVPLSRVTGERLRFLTEAEAKRLLKLWLEWDQPELWAFTVFGLHCGARLNSLLTIRWKDFGPDYCSVYFRGGTYDKNSNDRTLRMSKVAVDAVKLMRERHPDSLGPFMHFKKGGHLRTMWDRMQEATGWDDVVIHTLRHTCATWMLEATGNLQKVQKWLGHRRIETTLKYTKLVTGAFDGMADIMDRALG
jgi:integrase